MSHENDKSKTLREEAMPLVWSAHNVVTAGSVFAADRSDRRERDYEGSVNSLRRAALRYAVKRLQAEDVYPGACKLLLKLSDGHEP